MSKQEPADQVKFLVSCIGHTNNGRPDFQAVADNLGIVSKAAAQKRYERMLKAHGIKAGGRTNTAAKEESTTGSSNGETVSPAKRKAKAPAASPAKRRARTTRVAKKEDSDEEPKPIAKAKGLKQEEDVTPASPTSSLSDAPPSDEEES